MKAIVKTQRAAGAELVDLAMPKPKPDEALIRIEAASICGTDVHIYNWDPGAQVFIKNIPQILGHEFAGEIIEIGKNVKKFKIGDYVSAETHIFCGRCIQCRNNQRHICGNLRILGLSCDGCFAEYLVVPERILWKNNLVIPPEKACLQEPLGNAVYCALAEDQNLQGKKVLILGDGPTGLMAAGVAKTEGSPCVILVGRHKKRLEIAKKMGADLIFNDSGKQDPTKAILDMTDGRGLDVVLEMAGSKRAIELAFQLVRKGGRISAFGIFGESFTVQNYAKDIVTKGITIFGISGRKIWQTWEEVSDLLGSGRLDISPIITHKLPLEEFEKGFDLMTRKPKISGKVILYP